MTLGVNMITLYAKADMVFFRHRNSYFLIRSTTETDKVELDFVRIYGDPDVCLERVSVEQGLYFLVVGKQDDYPPITPVSYSNVLRIYHIGEAKDGPSKRAAENTLARQGICQRRERDVDPALAGPGGPVPGGERSSGALPSKDAG
jgi:hypothetical protein